MIKDEPKTDDSEFIISRPEKQGLIQKSIFATLTGLAWLGWIYLWLPLLTLLAWWAGLDRSWKYLVVNSSASNLYDLRLLLSIALSCSLASILWVTYNKRRFGPLRRRKEVDNTINERIADKLGSNFNISMELRRNRHSVLFIDEAGNPTGVDSSGHWVLGTDQEHGYDSRPLPSEHPDETIIQPDRG